MKRSILFLFALLLAATTALPAAAQRAPRGDADPAERLERRVDMLDRRLDLTDAQAAELLQLLQGQREDHRAALEQVLTPEQLAKLEADGPRMRRHRRGGAGLARALDLTDAQKDQLRETMQAMREAGRAWHEANPDATREERRAQREAHRAALDGALQGILTPEQLVQYEALEAERRQKRGQRDGQRGFRRGGPDQGAAAAPAPGADFGLANYPNPFNPTTEIRFDLPDAAHVTLAVYDLQGREVALLVDQRLSAGAHATAFDAASLPTGTYLYRLTADGATQTGRMTLVK